MRGLFFGSGRPRLAAPVERLRGRLLGLAFPPHVAVGKQRDVREDGVTRRNLHRVGIRLRVRAGRDAEVAELGIDGVEASVRAGFHPGNVVADGGDLPFRETRRRHEHGKICFPARAGERRREVGLFALRRFHAEDEHVFGEPAFVAPAIRGDAQREAFLAEQCVAAVIRPHGDDRVVLRKMRDVTALGIHIQRAMEAAIEIIALAKMFPGDTAHAGHHAHRERDIDGIGEFHADLGERRAGRSHQVRHDIHGAPAHRAVAHGAEAGIHFARSLPVVRRSRLVARGCADEGALLDARDVVGIGAMQVAAGKFLLVKFNQHARVHSDAGERVFFLHGAVAPENAVGLAERGLLRDPSGDVAVVQLLCSEFVSHRRREVVGNAGRMLFKNCQGLNLRRVIWLMAMCGRVRLRRTLFRAERGERSEHPPDS